MSLRMRSALIVAAMLMHLAISGCDPASNDSITVDHRMGFLADSMRQSPTAPPAQLVLYPPAWAQKYRDSVCFVLDVPTTQTGVYALDLVFRNPRTGDSLASGWTVFSTILRRRDISCTPVFFLGGRQTWQAPVEVEMTLRGVYEKTAILSRKQVLDPNFAQLDLHTFPVHFFPDQVGMEWLENITIDQADSTYIRRLIAWDMQPKDTSRFCAGDSDLVLQYHSRKCEFDNASDADLELGQCSAELDSSLAAGDLNIQERRECAEDKRVLVDSAVLTNGLDGYGLAYMFGKSRATLQTQFILVEGYLIEMLHTEGLGVSKFISVDSAAGTRMESKILAVK